MYLGKYKLCKYPRTKYHMNLFGLKRISNLVTRTSQSFTSAKMRSLRLVLLLAMVLTVESALISHTRLRQTRTNNHIFGQQLAKDFVQTFSQWLKKFDEHQWMTYEVEDEASTKVPKVIGNVPKQPVLRVLRRLRL